MSTHSDAAASARQKLLNRARSQGEDFQLLLTRYANERLLYRLSQSQYRDRFVLKGATLFAAWSKEPHRATRDIDLLGFGEFSEKQLAEAFSELARSPTTDGLTLDPNSVTVAPIRTGLRYGGLRVSLVSKLGTARIPLQIDVGFGDAYQVEAIELPTLLDHPAPKLRAYAKETVVSEKLEAMVTLGVANSRMKDFYDLATLADDFAFEGQSLVDALTATFDRRQTPLPSHPLEQLTIALRQEPSKPRQWAAFLKKATPRSRWTLEEALSRVTRFAEEPLQAAAGAPFSRTWPPKGPWQ